MFCVFVLCGFVGLWVCGFVVLWVGGCLVVFVSICLSLCMCLRVRMFSSGCVSVRDCVRLCACMFSTVKMCLCVDEFVLGLCVCVIACFGVRVFVCLFGFVCVSYR